MGPEIAILAGTAASGAGALLSGIASARQNQFQADLARSNAQAERQAAAAEAERVERENRRRIGATTAAFGAAGVQQSGTPLEVLADSAAEAEEDRLITLFGGESRARQQQARASSFQSQVGASLLGGGLQAAGNVGSGIGRYYETIG